MKIIIISLFLSFTVNAQNIWYVSPLGNGTNGNSWATAWNYFGTNSPADISNDVDWSVIGNGDTIYVDGGADSIIYLPYFSGQPHYFNQNGTEYTYTTQVVICPSWESGRNGRVILADDDVSSTQAIVTMGGYLNNVKLYGVTIQDLRPEGSPSLSMFLITGDDIVFESDTILTAGMGGGGGFLGLRGVLRNCVYIEPANETTTASDFMGICCGKGGITIEGCKVFIENNYEMISGDGTGMTATDTSMTVTGLSMTTNYHVPTTLKVGHQSMTITSNTSDTFYGTGGWHSSLGGGSENVAVTVGSNTLSDSRGTGADGTYIGWTITCGGSTMIISSNVSNTITGTTNWVGGTPSNGLAWTMEDLRTPANGSAWDMEGIHRDIVQFSVIDEWQAGENFENIIRNNLIVDQGTRGTGWNSMVYSSSSAADVRYLIYNNIFVNKEEISSGGIFLYESRAGEFNTSLRFFNNTIITKGDAAFDGSVYTSTTPISLEDMDTLYFKNNIIIVDTMHKAFINYSNNGVVDWDYNIYASDGYNVERFATAGAVRTWSQWVADLGYDVNGDTTYADNILFVNKYGREITDYYTETGRDLGDDLTDMPDYAGILSRHPDIIKDILGNDRDATPDIGALEFVTGGVDSLPNAFTFTDITGATRSTLYTSNGVTLAGFDSAYAYASGNTYTINAGSDLTGYTMVYPNDVLRLKLTSSGSYSTAVSRTLTVGGVSDTYTVTTGSDPGSPSNGGVIRGSNGIILKDKNGIPIKVMQ